MSTLDDADSSARPLSTSAGRVPSMPGRTLLVGCGRIGTLLGERLISAGGNVVALRRDITGLPATFSARPVDLREPLAHRLPEADAMVITLTPGMSRSPEYPDGYLDALAHLAAALPDVPPRVVFVSSTRVFEGRAGDQVLTEADDPAPVSPRGRTLRDGELAAEELFGAHIVRPAGIYGPGREMIVRKVLEQVPVMYARRTNRIHENDLVTALEKMLTLDDPPRLLHAVDQRPASLGEVVTFIADQLRMPPPPALQPDTAGGTVLSGELLREVVGTLRYPTFEAGYGDLLAHRAR